MRATLIINNNTRITSESFWKHLYAETERNQINKQLYLNSPILFLQVVLSFLRTLKLIRYDMFATLSQSFRPKHV